MDIGAGHGALTRHLIAAGARVIAVELHTQRVAHLRQQFAGDPVTVVAADAVTLRLPRHPFRVVASPPYSISSAVLRVLLAPGSRLVAADLVLQKAVVRRCVQARVPGANRWVRQWTLHAGRSLPRHAFRPPPHVDSAVLVIRRH
jgi:23S rRNA (adenine-N6)-dimethyltransferase